MQWSINFPGGLEFNRGYEGPTNGAKLTAMDILKFRDISQQTLCTQINAIPSFLNRGAHCGPPPGLIGLIKNQFQYPSKSSLKMCNFSQDWAKSLLKWKIILMQTFQQNKNQKETIFVKKSIFLETKVSQFGALQQTDQPFHSTTFSLQ